MILVLFILLTAFVGLLLVSIFFQSSFGSTGVAGALGRFSHSIASAFISLLRGVSQALFGRGGSQETQSLSSSHRGGEKGGGLAVEGNGETSAVPPKSVESNLSISAMLSALLGVLRPFESSGPHGILELSSRGGEERQQILAIWAVLRHNTAVVGVGGRSSAPNCKASVSGSLVFRDVLSVPWWSLMHLLSTSKFGGGDRESVAQAKSAAVEEVNSVIVGLVDRCIEGGETEIDAVLLGETETRSSSSFSQAETEKERKSRMLRSLCRLSISGAVSSGDWALLQALNDSALVSQTLPHWESLQETLTALLASGEHSLVARLADKVFSVSALRSIALAGDRLDLALRQLSLQESSGGTEKEQGGGPKAPPPSVSPNHQPREGNTANVAKLLSNVASLLCESAGTRSAVPLLFLRSVTKQGDAVLVARCLQGLGGQLRLSRLISEAEKVHGICLPPDLASKLRSPSSAPFSADASGKEGEKGPAMPTEGGGEGEGVERDGQLDAVTLAGALTVIAESSSSPSPCPPSEVLKVSALLEHEIKSVKLNSQALRALVTYAESGAFSSLSALEGAMALQSFVSLAATAYMEGRTDKTQLYAASPETGQAFAWVAQGLLSGWSGEGGEGTLIRLVYECLQTFEGPSGGGVRTKPNGVEDSPRRLWTQLLECLRVCASRSYACGPEVSALMSQINAIIETGGRGRSMMEDPQSLTSNISSASSSRNANVTPGMGGGTHMVRNDQQQQRQGVMLPPGFASNCPPDFSPPSLPLQMQQAALNANVNPDAQTPWGMRHPPNLSTRFSTTTPNSITMPPIHSNLPMDAQQFNSMHPGAHRNLPGCPPPPPPPPSWAGSPHTLDHSGGHPYSTSMRFPAFSPSSDLASPAPSPVGFSPHLPFFPGQPPPPPHPPPPLQVQNAKRADWNLGGMQTPEPAEHGGGSAGFTRRMTEFSRGLSADGQPVGGEGENEPTAPHARLSSLFAEMRDSSSPVFSRGGSAAAAAYGGDPRGGGAECEAANTPVNSAWGVMSVRRGDSVGHSSFPPGPSEAPFPLSGNFPGPSAAGDDSQCFTGRERERPPRPSLSLSVSHGGHSGHNINTGVGGGASEGDRDLGDLHSSAGGNHISSSHNPAFASAQQSKHRNESRSQQLSSFPPHFHAPHASGGSDVYDASSSSSSHQLAPEETDTGNTGEGGGEGDDASLPLPPWTYRNKSALVSLLQTTRDRVQTKGLLKALRTLPASEHASMTWEDRMVVLEAAVRTESADLTHQTLEALWKSPSSSSASGCLASKEHTPLLLQALCVLLKGRRLECAISLLEETSKEGLHLLSICTEADLHQVASALSIGASGVSPTDYMCGYLDPGVYDNLSASLLVPLKCLDIHKERSKGSTQTARSRQESQWRCTNTKEGWMDSLLSAVEARTQLARRVLDAASHLGPSSSGSVLLPLLRLVPFKPDVPFSLSSCADRDREKEGEGVGGAGGLTASSSSSSTLPTLSASQQSQSQGGGSKLSGGSERKEATFRFVGEGLSGLMVIGNDRALVEERDAQLSVCVLKKVEELAGFSSSFASGESRTDGTGEGNEQRESVHGRRKGRAMQWRKVDRGCLSAEALALTIFALLKRGLAQRAFTLAEALRSAHKGKDEGENLGSPPIPSQLMAALLTAEGWGGSLEGLHSLWSLAVRDATAPQLGGEGDTSDTSREKEKDSEGESQNSTHKWNGLSEEVVEAYLEALVRLGAAESALSVVDRLMATLRAPPKSALAFAASGSSRKGNPALAQPESRKDHLPLAPKFLLPVRMIGAVLEGLAGASLFAACEQLYMKLRGFLALLAAARPPSAALLIFHSALQAAARWAAEGQAQAGGPGGGSVGGSGGVSPSGGSPLSFSSSFKPTHSIGLQQGGGKGGSGREREGDGGGAVGLGLRFAEVVWRDLMVQKGIPKSESSFVFWMKVHAAAGLADECVAMREEMTARGIGVSVETINVLIEACLKAQPPQQERANSLWMELLRGSSPSPSSSLSLFGPNETTLVTLVRFHSRARRLRRAFMIVQEALGQQQAGGGTGGDTKKREGEERGEMGDGRKIQERRVGCGVWTQLLIAQIRNRSLIKALKLHNEIIAKIGSLPDRVLWRSSGAPGMSFESICRTVGEALDSPWLLSSGSSSSSGEIGGALLEFLCALKERAVEVLRTCPFQLASLEDEEANGSSLIPFPRPSEAFELDRGLPDLQRRVRQAMTDERLKKNENETGGEEERDENQPRGRIERDPNGPRSILELFGHQGSPVSSLVSSPEKEKKGRDGDAASPLASAFVGAQSQSAMAQEGSASLSSSERQTGGGTEKALTEAPLLPPQRQRHYSNVPLQRHPKDQQRGITQTLGGSQKANTTSQRQPPPSLSFSYRPQGQEQTQGRKPPPPPPPPPSQSPSLHSSSEPFSLQGNMSPFSYHPHQNTLRYASAPFLPHRSEEGSPPNHPHYHQPPPPPPPSFSSSRPHSLSIHAPPFAPLAHSSPLSQNQNEPFSLATSSPFQHRDREEEGEGGGAGRDDIRFPISALPKPLSPHSPPFVPGGLEASLLLHTQQEAGEEEKTSKGRESAEKALPGDALGPERVMGGWHEAASVTQRSPAASPLTDLPAVGGHSSSPDSFHIQSSGENFRSFAFFSSPPAGGVHPRRADGSPTTIGDMMGERGEGGGQSDGTIAMTQTHAHSHSHSYDRLGGGEGALSPVGKGRVEGFPRGGRGAFSNALSGGGRFVHGENEVESVVWGADRQAVRDVTPLHGHLDRLEPNVPLAEEELARLSPPMELKRFISSKAAVSASVHGNEVSSQGRTPSGRFVPLFANGFPLLQEDEGGNGRRQGTSVRAGSLSPVSAAPPPLHSGSGSGGHGFEDLVGSLSLDLGGASGPMYRSPQSSPQVSPLRSPSGQGALFALGMAQTPMAGGVGGGALPEDESPSRVQQQSGRVGQEADEREGEVNLVQGGRSGCFVAPPSVKSVGEIVSETGGGQKKSPSRVQVGEGVLEDRKGDEDEEDRGLAGHVPNALATMRDLSGSVDRDVR
uniref:Uncharacterized protein n=1 Tax=Chromera velia CCMP2878 TaxID=1169474 RepID=A0A0G4HRM1_9ALVE|eukprot:Cvel_8112.t1-p1 / transcript=Cvel_8112.t1 / gene=Cvel_8112 / organism=Chromera_velia_CCMP2878 / gene_product=hypothetical protein / transcript_product=hypothetical protein / location=Cvel_scaffold441:35139-50318(-) / protein_length=3028 / sequence_SO=supercontig / SO=protein_coding / is_pseudo=false